MNRKAILFALALALASAPVIASAATYSVDFTLGSVHASRWARSELNQRNLGLGMTAQMSRNWAISGGWYRNSYRRGSLYLLADFTPWHRALPGGWSLSGGLTAGLDSGYRTRELATQPLVAAGLLRVIAPAGWSFDLTAMPNAPHHRSGFLGLQISLPI